MRRNGMIVAAFLVGGSLLASGCEQARDAVGLEKRPPDEFSVVTRAPLSIPPDFGLRPPAPGTKRPQEQSVRNQARDILLRESARNGRSAAQAATQSGKFSKGEVALLSRAGALGADPTIRNVVNRESSALVEANENFFDKVFFWQEVDPAGTIVDPEKESRRLREARAIGEPPNKGEVPVIKRRERGILEGIF